MKNSNKYFLILFFASVFLFLLIFLIGDEKVFLFINKKIANPILDFFVLKIFTPSFLLIGIYPLSLLFSKKNRKLGIFSLFSGPFCYFIGNLIKPFFGQPRPLDIVAARILGFFHFSPFSFPSTTTMLAFGFALPILFEKSKFGIFFLILAFLVGFSVIYTGFHFPQDVIGGIIFSILIVFFLNKGFEKLK